MAKIAPMEEFEAYMPEILDRIIAYVSEEETAESGIDYLAEHVIEDHRLSGNPREGEILAEAVIMVANHVVEVLRRAQCYDENGKLLDFQFRGWRDRRGNTAIFEYVPDGGEESILPYHLM